MQDLLTVEAGDSLEDCVATKRVPYAKWVITLSEGLPTWPRAVSGEGCCSVEAKLTRLSLLEPEL
jgi:hypothetical protein